ncbi:MAG: AAA family ATPase [Candidatus Latescibacterota bacterium]|nr:MAG: AAA family ATPase [Candidatus Latescibacterota bacterium]
MAVVLFVNLKGGVAKTTNAVAVAETLAERNRRVLVIDADHQCAAGELLLGEKRLLMAERRRATLHDMLAAMLDDEFGDDQFEDFIERGASNISGGMPNLAVLPCSLRIDDFSTNMARARRGYRSTEEFNAVYRRRRTMLRKWLIDNFDFTIIDCPPSIALQVQALLHVADAYIVPSIPDRLSLRGSAHLVERIRRTGSKVNALGILWSLYRSNNEVHRKVISRASKQHRMNLPRPFKTVIPNATAIARAFEHPLTPATLSLKYEPPFAALFRQACDEMIHRLHASVGNLVALREPAGVK